MSHSTVRLGNGSSMFTETPTAWIAGKLIRGKPFTREFLCVPKIRFCNIVDEGRRGQAVM
jgi:hypothetical protein